jgi:hypothetical protein
MANFYRDIFINKGDDFSEIIDISVPFDEYDFTGTVRSSVESNIGIPISFEAVETDTRKMRISIPSELTATLRRRRGVYSILATNKITEDQFTERQGTAHYSQAPSFVPAEPPPPNYVVQLENIEGAGSAAGADIEDFATAAQGELAESALQAASVTGAVPVESLDDKEFLLKGSPIDSVTWTKLKELLQLYFDEIYGGGQELVLAENFDDLFFPVEVPELGTPGFISNDSKFVKYIGNTGEGRIGHIISGLPVPEANGKYALTGTENFRNYYYSENGFSLSNDIQIVDDQEQNRFVFRNDNSDIIAYSNINSYSYPFANELTWYDASDDSEIAVTFADWVPGSYYSWQVDVADLVPNFQSGIWIRNEYGWQRIPEHLEGFFNSWSIEMAKDSLLVNDLLVLSQDDFNNGGYYSSPKLIYVRETGQLYSLNESLPTSDAKPIQIKQIYRHDFDGLNSYNYLGKAVFGSQEADAVWTVTRLTIASNGSVTSEPAFTLISWNDRANPLNYNS